MIKIDKKIVDFKVVKPDEKKAEPATPSTPPPPEVPALAERGETLSGTTYKIKPPTQSHALYLTLNDSIGADGAIAPFEIFINSKNMEHFQWIVALTRLISAVFRKGGDVTFLVEELKSVFDPNGGYWLKGQYHHSVVAHIGAVIEQHLKGIGLVGMTLDEEQAALIFEKRKEYASRHGTTDKEFPLSATVCGKCSAKAVVVMDGCATCLNCGDSKCG